MDSTQSTSDKLIGTASTADAGRMLPVSSLTILAERFRPAGLGLFVVSPAGEVLFADDFAHDFFKSYVRPQLGESPIASATSPVGLLSGVSAVTVPLSERKQSATLALLVARSDVAADSVEWYGGCQAAGVDPQLASQQLQELPSYSDTALTRQRDLLQAAVRDQVRLDHLEHELGELSGQLSDTYEELSLIYQISGGMRVNRRPADFFQQTCADAIDVMSVAGMGVALQAGAKLGQAPVVFGKPDWDPAIVQRLSAELLAWMRSHKTSLISNDLSKELRFRWLAPHAKRLLAAPLQRGQDVLGCLFAVDKASGDFDSVDSKLLNSIANESAIFLENAVLFEDVHGLMMGLLHSLTSAVDAKDTYTCGHSERVAVLSRAIARAAGLDEQLVERIYMAGLLHDVGKIGVPESVLQKPGRLTNEEFEQMKKHTVIGARILQDVQQIEDIIPGVMHHHERYDGKGYPHGLAGKAIPIMGRIICMADCFDAMTSTRTYRKALPLEVTLADLRRCSGTQFDPEIAEAFFRIDDATLQDIIRQTPINFTKAVANSAAALPSNKAA